MSLMHNQQKIKSLIILCMFIEIVIIVYIYSAIYINLNFNSDIRFLFNHFEVNFNALDSLNSAIARDLESDFYITASKNGSKFYYKNCSGISRIKIENRVYFSSEEEALLANYSLAKNCSK